MTTVHRRDRNAATVRRVCRVDLMIPLAPEPEGEKPGTIVPGYRVLGDGSIAIPCRIARTGILEYTYDEPEGEAAGGRTVREYRSPDEVFDRKSLDSFKGITVCNDHPNGEVDPSNWKGTAIGHIGDTVEPDGIFVRGEVIVKDGASIQDAKDGKLRELSAGYTCGIIEEPGVAPDGEPYDAIQVGILANHVALGPAGWGRSGGDVRLYLDSKHGRARRVESKRKADNMDPEELLAKYNETVKQLEEAKAKIAELEAKVADKSASTSDAGEEEQTTDSDDESGESEDKGDKKADKRSTSDAMFARIERKAEILARVKSITKNDSLSGVNHTNRELILMGIRHVDAKFDDKGKSTDYLRAILDERFDSVIKQRAKNKEGLDLMSFTYPKIERVDADGKPTDEKKKQDADEDPQAKYEQKQRDRWKTPRAQ